MREQRKAAKRRGSIQGDKSHGFVDQNYQQRLTEGYAARLQAEIESRRLRPMAQFSAAELAVLEKKLQGWVASGIGRRWAYVTPSAHESS